MTQQDIRKQTLVLRDQISKQQHSQDSERICRRVLELQCVRDADSVLTYAPIRSEVDVWPLTIRLTEQGKTVLLPVVSEDALVLKEYRGKHALQTGRFGVLEPDQVERYMGEVDVCILPGAAFDRFGNRIGYGKGFYDRFLDHRGTTIKIGVGFNEQVVEKIPAKSTDVRMDYLVTPLWTNCRNSVE